MSELWKYREVVGSTSDASVWALMVVLLCAVAVVGFIGLAILLF